MASYQDYQKYLDEVLGRIVGATDPKFASWNQQALDAHAPATQPLNTAPYQQIAAYTNGPGAIAAAEQAAANQPPASWGQAPAATGYGSPVAAAIASGWTPPPPPPPIGSDLPLPAQVALMALQNAIRPTLAMRQEKHTAWADERSGNNRLPNYPGGRDTAFAEPMNIPGQTGDPRWSASPYYHANFVLWSRPHQSILGNNEQFRSIDDDSDTGSYTYDTSRDLVASRLAQFANQRRSGESTLHAEAARASNPQSQLGKQPGARDKLGKRG